MRIMPELIDIGRVDEIIIAGRGGYESDISQLLPKWNRTSEPLYDYEIKIDNSILHLEVKKQENLQWFDSGKYHRLSDTDREIRIMFLIHKKGKIRIIAVTLLGEFLDWLFLYRNEDGWNEEVLRIGADFKERYPRLQFKAPAKIVDIIKAAPELFDIEVV